MSGYGLNSIRGYFDEKQFKGNELVQFGIMMTVAILLIVGGVFILQDEDIFRKIYEGYVTSITLTSVPSGGTCPSGSTLYSNDTNTERRCVTNCSSSETLSYPDGTAVTGTVLLLSKLIQGNPTSGLQCVTTGTGGTSGGTSGGIIAQTKVPTSSRWNATLPEDLTLGQLQKNVSLIRKKSQTNIYTGYTMIATGSIISLYQIYNLFF